MKLLILIPLVIAFTDQIGFQIKKLKLIERPCVNNEQIHHLGGKGILVFIYICSNCWVFPNLYWSSLSG